MSATTSYDDVPYVSSPFWHTHPDRMATLGRVCGMAPADPEGCRVLELGCGLGGNLIPMALALPESSFLGIDLSATQIEQASQEASSLGLTNIEFRQANILDLDEAPASYDYLICHGVYSWVPRQVQDAILETFRALLAPQGIAFVSYNTKPGWAMRGMIRDLMRYHTAQFDDPKQKISQARAVLNYVARETREQEETPYALLLAKELALVSNCTDTYLYHEHLEANNEAVYLQEFVDRVNDAGLRYLGGAGVGDLWTTVFPTRGKKSLTRGSAEYTRLEQYRDFVKGRHFRMSLLVGKSVKLRDEPDWRAISELFVAAPPPEESGVEGHPEWEETSALARAAVHVLGPVWPQSLRGADVLKAARERVGHVGQPPPSDDDERTMAEGLLSLFAAGQIELRPRRLPFEPAVSERPRACGYARLQAEDRDAPFVTNRRHDPIGLNNYLRRLLLLLDGTRTRGDLVTELVQLAVSNQLEVKTEDGEPITELPLLEEVFTKNVGEQLTLLGSLALLVA